MKQHIHILGASGSGTSTLAKAISEKYGYKHFDTDDYYWLPAEEPFSKVRPVAERITLLQNDLQRYPNWVLSGSLCGWGDVFIPYFDLVIFIWIPTELRMQRLQERQLLRYGEDIAVGGKQYESNRAFMEWAAKYDEAGLEIRSKQLHEAWLADLPCNVVRLEGNIEVREKLMMLEDIMNIG